MPLVGRNGQNGPLSRQRGPGEPEAEHVFWCRYWEVIRAKGVPAGREIWFERDLGLMLGLKLLTNCQQLRKHLGSSDQTIDIVASILPFDAAVGVEAFVFHPVKLPVANTAEGKTG